MRYSIISNINNLLNWEKYVFHWEKRNFEHIANSQISGLRKDSEHLYQLFDVLPKQKINETKTLQIKVYIQQ